MNYAINHIKTHWWVILSGSNLIKTD